MNAEAALLVLIAPSVAAAAVYFIGALAGEVWPYFSKF